MGIRAIKKEKEKGTSGKRYIMASIIHCIKKNQQIFHNIRLDYKFANYY